MKRGKDLCRLLRQIRQDIATEYDLSYTPFECHHKGNCKGSCEKCDAELLDIQKQLYNKGISNIVIRQPSYDRTKE